MARKKKFDKSAGLKTKIVVLYPGHFFATTLFVTFNKWTQNMFCNVLLITLEYVHNV